MITTLPSQQQLDWQKLEFGVFIHFGLNTFAGVEWSDGTLNPSSFDPLQLDARQWAEAARNAGAKYLILTAKHHDGFCLWPSATTDYTVASSPWKAGTGDVVREAAEACSEFGLAFGIYLSPWDRNAECYEDATAYDDFYIAQLTELCTGYGPLVEVWFDGAGSEGRSYNWERISAVISEHQPNAMVFNMGNPPTIRWVGNEDGLALDPVKYVVDRTDTSQYSDSVTDLGRSMYLPPECDVSIRRGWFWHEDDEPKTAEHLLAIYYRSVGMGANLLLNLPPDTRGLIPSRDVERLHAFRAQLDTRLRHRIAGQLEAHPEGVSLVLPADTRIGHIELAEDLSLGQKITSHRVTVDGKTIASGLTVGSRRLHQISPPILARRLVVFLEGDEPTLLTVSAYEGEDDWPVPQIPDGYEAPTEQPHPR